MAYSILLCDKFPMAAGSVAINGTTLLDATTDLVGWTYQAEEDCTITTVGIRRNAKTLADPGTLRIGLQSVSGRVNSGTWLASGNGYADFSDWSSTSNATAFTVTLNSSVSLTRGEFFCIVAQPTSGTWGSDNSVTIADSMINQISPLKGFPHWFFNETGTTTLGNTGFGIPMVFYRSSSKSYATALSTITTTNFRSSFDPDEWGLEFTVPTTWFSTFKVKGCRISATTTTTGNLYNVSLYEGSTLRQQVSNIDNDDYRNATANYEFWFDESSLHQCQTGTAYIISVEVLNELNMGRHAMTLLDQLDRTAWTDLTVRGATRKDTGAWSYSETEIPMIQVLIDVDGVAGSLLVHPGMAGGMRG